MPTKERADQWKPWVTYVIGHQRPDMDAIGAALGYAWFLGHSSESEVQAARAGPVGTQAAFALNYFSEKAPRALSNAAPTFAHVALTLEPVAPHTPLSRVMDRFAHGDRLVPVVDGEGKLAGGLSPMALARAYAHVASGRIVAAVQTCGSYVEASPTLLAGDRISDHRRTLFRSDGDDFIVVTEAAQYLGTTTRRRLLDPPRARLILVDHNEIAQAVPGTEEAEIIGVLDHHRLGNAATASPIPFVVEPVGSTCTLVAEVCRRHGLTPPDGMAGVMLSGILSDTLVFHSPTTTERDRVTADWLAKLCGTNIEKYGQHLIHASPGLADRSADEILDSDRKNYEMAGRTVSIAQIEVTGFGELPEHRQDLLEAMATRRDRENLSLICLMVSDVITVESRLLCVGEEDILTNLSFQHLDASEFDLGKVVSRKKQLVPALQSVLEELYGA